MASQTIKNNDSIVLISKTKKDKYCLKIEDKTQKYIGFGIFNPIKLVGTSYGTTVRLGLKEFWVLPANSLDFIETLKRKAQIILPKDSALIGTLSNIKPGSIVVEGGLGSGALTIILLTLVSSSGKVITYETSKEFAKVGSDNIRKAGLKESWNLKIQDITKGISEKNVDAVVLDIPEPWKVVNTAYNALLPGGYLTCYLPTMNQVEKLVETINKKPFIEVRSFETIYRDLVVKAGATRPTFDMLGHTGYITIARKVLEV